MQVLHAHYSPAEPGLTFWVETTDTPAPKPQRGRVAENPRPKPHPFSVAPILAACQGVSQDGEKRRIVLQLPTVRGIPLPSPQLVHNWELETDNPSLAPFVVDGIFCPPETALAVLLEFSTSQPGSTGTVYPSLVFRYWSLAASLALTGTPVENRLSELWSIMHFLNPGYLGARKAFRENFALPIERYQDKTALEQLKTLTTPFILRRVKTDPRVISDLPEKVETKVYCTLTEEQATLYEAVVQDVMKRIEEEDGMQRRGLVLSMLMQLKQICNHPVQYLHQSGKGALDASTSFSERSGKLERLGELLEEILADGDRALIFTQFAEMGQMLADYLPRAFGAATQFLHGGAPSLALTPSVLVSRNRLKACSRTGTRWPSCPPAGKSLIFQLAALQLPGVTLVISPLIALMKDQVDALTRMHPKLRECAPITCAAFYHAGLPAEQRARIQDDFISGRLNVIASTNAFGTGIDRADVRQVIHYSIPGSLEACYQEAGRAGYDGLPARVILLTLMVLALPALACRPVLAIGWGELLFFLLLFLLLLGPPLWRFWRKWRRFQRAEERRE